MDRCLRHRRAAPGRVGRSVTAVGNNFTLAHGARRCQQQFARQSCRPQRRASRKASESAFRIRVAGTAARAEASPVAPKRALVATFLRYVGTGLRKRGGQEDFNRPPVRRREEDARANVHAAGVALLDFRDRAQNHRSRIPKMACRTCGEERRPLDKLRSQHRSFGPVHFRGLPFLHPDGSTLRTN